MPSKEEVVAALHQVEDPELGMDIVELGLLYDVEVDGPNVPECLRQKEQWQWFARVNGSSTSKRTPPQRQLPPTVAISSAAVGLPRGARARRSGSRPRNGPSCSACT